MKIFLVLLFLLVQGVKAQAVSANQFEYRGYFRSGIGVNSLGGNHECFYNKNTESGHFVNEFRLGNECGTYGEATFLVHHLKSEDNEPFFRSQIRLAYISQGFKAYEGRSEIDQEDDAFHLVEAYVQGGHFSDAPYSFWAGKRFYRESDLYMNDWYYYGNTVGNGAGIEEIPVGIGQLALAQLREVDTHSVIGSNPGQAIRTEVGRPGITVWDARLKNIILNDHDKMEFWVAYGHAPQGTAKVAPYTTYEKSQGIILGTKNHLTFSGGFYDFALLHGSGLMQTLELNGNALAEQGVSTQSKSSRWRIVNHVNYQIPESNWAFLAGLNHEAWNTGEDHNSSGRWTSVGILPVYFLSDHVQLTGQVGASLVKIDSETDANGDPLGLRTLYRVTLAPQLALAKALSARPVIRAYYTQSWWNRPNTASVADTGGAPAYFDKTSGSAYGFQAEVWF